MTSVSFQDKAEEIPPDDEDGGDSITIAEDDSYCERLRQEAHTVLQVEPEMSSLFEITILAPGVTTFEGAVAHTLCHRLLSSTASPPPSPAPGPGGGLSPVVFFDLTMKCMLSKVLEHGSTMADAIRGDAMAVLDRDPATDTLLEVVLFGKGFAALVAHHVAYRLWHMARRYAALFVQSQTSAVFGVDIHPLSQIGRGVMFDHATGVVVGETATIGDGCTVMHGVTLGGTGKDHGDRHPKVGNHVLIGAGSLLLGNIRVGDSAKIGAGSVLLRSIPPHATAVGVPAKIIGRADESDPGKEVDAELGRVSLLRRVPSSIATHTVSTVSLTDASSVGSAATSDDGAGADGAGTTTNKGGGGYHADTVETADLGSFHKLASLSLEDAFCPYREYYLLAAKAPRGTVSIKTLRSALLPRGVSPCLVGACFFEMDHRGKGYIKAVDFVREGAECISRVCEIPIDEATRVVSDALALST